MLSAPFHQNTSRGEEKRAAPVDALKRPVMGADPRLAVAGRLPLSRVRSIALDDTRFEADRRSLKNGQFALPRIASSALIGVR
jgi:hypothetical protein